MDNRARFRLAQARRIGVPGMIANMANVILSGREDLKPLVIVAVDDLLVSLPAPNERALITWPARFTIARAIADRWARDNGVTDSDRITARVYGEIMASHAVMDQTSIPSRNLARGKMVRILRNNAPNAADLRTYIAEVVRICRHAGTGTVIADDHRDVLPLNLEGEVTEQVLKFYICRGQTFDHTILASENARNAWVSLSVNSADFVDLDGVDWSLGDNIQTWWSGLTEDSILGFYEGRAETAIGYVRNMLAGAVFTHLTLLAKDGNITPTWVHRRRTQFATAFPELNLDDAVSHQVCVHYAAMYPKQTMNWEPLYKMVSISWNHLSQQGVIPLTWMLEQVAMSNVTSFATIADVVGKLTYFNCDYLIDRGVPESNFRSIMRLAADLYYNTYSSLSKPTIVLREYADVAYMCTFVKKDLMKDSVFGGYRGNTGGMCTLSEVNLRHLASDCWNVANDVFDRLETLADHYVAIASQEQKTVINIGGSTFEYVALENAPNAGQDAAAANEDVEDARNKLEAQRAAWPRAARRLPANARLLTQGDMVKALKLKLSDRAQAFKRTMETLTAAGIQAPLPLSPDNATAVHMPFRTLTQRLIDDMNIWMVDIPEIYTQPIPDYVPGEGTGLTHDNITCEPRETVNLFEDAEAPGLQAPNLIGEQGGDAHANE